jgi:hypothetical protein
MSIQYYQEQKFMLRTTLGLKFIDSIAHIKYSRESEKLEIRGQILQKEMDKIKELMVNSNVEEKTSEDDPMWHSSVELKYILQLFELN